jgi:hypothetical protein
MNKKIFGAIAVSIAALGSAIIAVPAQAVEQTVDVSVNVEPFIYLRTFKDVKLKVTQGDLGAISGDYNVTPTTTGSTLIDRTKPLSFGTANATTLSKDITELYAVWGNTANEVKVTVTPVVGKNILTGPIGSDTQAKITVGDTIGVSQQKPSSVGKSNFVGGVKLNISFQDVSGADAPPAAGDYIGGQLKVDASQL